MKIGYISCLLLFIHTYAVVAQQEPYDALTEAIQNVQIKDDIYEQSFAYDADNNCLLTFTILDTDKGEETVYQVNASDLNEYKVRFDTKSKSAVVEAETRGGRDLVRVQEDGEVKGYEDKFELYAQDVENARSLVDALKEVIKSCGEQSKEVLIDGQASPSFSELLDFLSSTIGEVALNGEQFNQSFSYDSEQPTLFTYTWEDATEGESRKYVASIADFNEQSVSFNTEKGGVWLTLETQGGRDLIQTYEDGELNDYEKEMEIMATDIEQARVLEKALKLLVASSADQTQDAFIPSNPEPDLNTTARYLTEQVGDVNLGKEVYEQSFSYDADAQQIQYEVVDVDKGDKNSFRVNPADINANSIVSDTKGEAVLITLETQGERDLIQELENDQVEGYENEITIRAPGVQEARHQVEALKRLVTLARTETQDPFAALGDNPDQAVTLQFLQENVGEVVAGEDAYQQTFTPASGNPCLVSYSVVEEEKGKEETYEWNMADINANQIIFDTKGTSVLVTLVTRGENDLIKAIEEGEVDGYEDEVELRANSIEEARSLVSAFKHLAGLCDK